MAKTSNIAVPGWVKKLHEYRTLALPIFVVLGVIVIVVPMPPILMDLLIAANLALATLILLTTIFVKSPLEFSVFPSLLLFTTLMRLVLNIATTRLILTPTDQPPEQATAVAGHVIQAFSSFVTGGTDNGGIVVGVIMFTILVIIQFVVITKGATRISEVAARFTLDAMPGKQMAIDADLNAGLIDEKEAKDRREKIQHEADFHGAMDGASKFVRGDAVAGIIITLVNIIGGFTVGLAINGWGIGETAAAYTLLTIGDGLVSQIPAFIIAIAAGLIVTRTSSREDLNTELLGQLTGKWVALAITAGFLASMSFVGLPFLPMMGLASLCGGMAFFVYRQERTETQQKAKAAETQAKKSSEPEPVEQAMHVDTLELEVGYALVRLVDTSQGGDLLDRITMIRRQLAAELGLVMPPVRIRDNMQFQPNDYHIKIRGNAVAQGQVYPGQFMALDAGLVSPGSAPLQGIKCVEPAFGQQATWIDSGQKQRAEALNYYVVDPTSVLATHLTEVVKTHGAEMLTREETNNLIAQLKDKAPKLTGEVLEGETPMVKPGELQKVLQNLLRERVPIRDLEGVVETLGDWATRTKDLEVLTEYARNGLRRTICSQYAVQEPAVDEPGLENPPLVSRLYCVSLDPALEDQINGYIERSAEGTSMTMPPAVANRITAAVMGELQRLIDAGRTPVVLASPQVRAQVRRLIEPHLPGSAVLGYNEISKGVEVESMGLATLSAENEAGSGLGMDAPGAPVSAAESAMAGDPQLQRA
ncbi:MAG: flagellar biosynthesis protein FlhA [Planctomycetota bacterium]